MEIAADSPRCPACRQPVSSQPTIVGGDRLHGTSGTFTVLSCQACGSGVTLPLVKEEGLADLYPSSYNAYALPAGRLSRRLATLLFRWRYWRNLRRFPLNSLFGRPGARLLDVGGGRGDLGLVLAKYGWEVTTLDPSQEACGEARSRGLTSVCGTLISAQETLAEEYDVVVFQHSLEHVVDPLAILRLAYQRLVDDGILIVTLPNFDCWQRRRFGAEWFHLDLPRHRSHFTPRGLSRLLEGAGFEPSALGTSTSPDGLPMSLEYVWFGRRLSAQAARYLSAAVSQLSAPAVSILNRLLGGGDVLHARATKLSEDRRAAIEGSDQLFAR